MYTVALQLVYVPYLLPEDGSWYSGAYFKKKVRQPTRKQEVGMDGTGDGSELVRGIECDCVAYLLLLKKNRRLSVLEASTVTVYRIPCTCTA